MGYKETFEQWKNQENLDDDLKIELANLKDDGEIEDRFYDFLSFGTAGMRGKLGAGTNRMNNVMVARATYGLAQQLIEASTANADKGVAIAYDSRIKSDEFAKTAACVLAAQGVHAYLFESLRPTPMLSFAVRYLGCAGGIMITASHNPKEYNGYKVYGSDGAQLANEAADAVVDVIEHVDNYFSIPKMNFQEAQAQGLIEIIGKDVDEAYYKEVEKVVHMDQKSDLIIVYTPLHGTGNIPVRRVLSDMGFKNVHVVPEQENPDGNFPTVEFPNPEYKEVFNLAIPMAEKLGADLILGTDPDGDRVGVVNKNSDGEYVVFTGNQTGALLVDYILKTRPELPDNKAIIKTIVTSELGAVIARAHGATPIDVLTGFKYIGEHITDWQTTHEHTFALGYEESYGYLAGEYARDKDAVVASALICEMAAYYKDLGKTLYDALQDLYKQYGYFEEGIQSFAFEGVDGKEKMDKLMNVFRDHHIPAFGDEKLVTVNDYKDSESLDVATGKETKIDLPSSNVLKFMYDKNSWFALRPSGTEPKLKIYYSTYGKSKEEASKNMEELKAAVNKVKEEN
ncbi:MAG: phospho-sugar mutase [Eubacteriaceae bacterium]